jgi:hypothetical protein
VSARRPYRVRGYGSLLPSKVRDYYSLLVLHVSNGYGIEITLALYAVVTGHIRPLELVSVPYHTAEHKESKAIVLFFIVQIIEFCTLFFGQFIEREQVARAVVGCGADRVRGVDSSHFECPYCRWIS